LSALRERVRRLKAVVDAGALAQRTFDLSTIAEQIISTAARCIGAERGSLFLVDRETGVLSSLVAQGVDGRPLVLAPGEGIVGAVVRTGKPILLSDPYSDWRFDPSVDEATGFTTRSLLTVPVRSREGRLVAVLQLLNHRRGRFTQGDVSFLAELAVPFAAALETAHNHQAILERERLLQEIRTAAEIQETLRPKDLHAVRGLEISVLCKPCLEVGGDYYDCIPGRDGSWWLVVADVSGKGVPAALIASNMQAFLWCRRNSGTPLAETAAEGNNLLYKLAEGRKYLSLVLAEWWPGSRELRWVNAGHPPMLLQKKRKKIQRLGATGPPLGLLPGMSFTSGSLLLDKGDVLLALTDGVTEASRELGGEEFGLERAAQCLKRSGGAETVVHTLNEAVTAFLAGGSLRDDLTVLCARCLG